MPEDDNEYGLGYSRSIGEVHEIPVEENRCEEKDSQNLIQKPKEFPNPATIQDPIFAVMQKAQAIALKLKSPIHNILYKDKRRTQLALLKNFEYLSKKDEQSYKAQLLEIEHMKEEGKALEKEGEQNYEWKKTNVGQKRNKDMCMSGIGSETRKRLQRSEGKDRGVSSGVASFYVSGFRRHTQGNNDIEMEKEIRHLFGSYGKIQRIKLYKHVSTNSLKGDALVVYRDGAIIVESVCTQLNGAELPCGDIITVQPACFNSKSNVNGKNTNAACSSNAGMKISGKNKTDENMPSESFVSVNVANNEKTIENTAVENDTDDLDDFFASLT